MVSCTLFTDGDEVIICSFSNIDLSGVVTQSLAPDDDTEAALQPISNVAAESIMQKTVALFLSKNINYLFDDDGDVISQRLK